MHAVNKRSCQNKDMMWTFHCLFFLEARIGFELVAAHLPGRGNMLANDLSHNKFSDFLSRAQSLDRLPSKIQAGLQDLLLDHEDWRSRHWTRRFNKKFCYTDVAESTRRTYLSGLNRFMFFCFGFGVPAPFPISESFICYFVTSLARDGITPVTIRMYLDAVRHTQIIPWPEPRESPRLFHDCAWCRTRSAGSWLPGALPLSNTY